MCRHRFTRRLDQRGVAAIEFAIVLPVLLLIAFGLIDFGRAVWSQTTLDYAAQATARCLAIGSTACSSATTYAQAHAYGVTLSNVTPTTIASGGTACGQTSSVAGEQVVAKMAFNYIFPAFSSFSSGTFSACGFYPT